MRSNSLVATVFLVWAVCFGLSLDDVLRSTPYSPILVSPAASSEAYPMVASFKTALGAESSGLAIGDLLLGVAETDLRGADYSRWVAAINRAAGPAKRVDVHYRRGDDREIAELELSSHVRYWPRLVASVAFAGCALFLLLAVRDSQLARAHMWMNLATAVLMVCFFEGGLLETRASLIVHGVSLAFVAPLALRAFLIFPHGVPPSGAWARYGPWAFALIAPFDVSRFTGAPFSHTVGAVSTTVIGVAFIAILATVVTFAYRQSDRVGRRRLKWVILGTYLASACALTALVVATQPGAGWLLAAGDAGTAILPICVMIAIARFNFLDVDRVLSAAGSVTILACVTLVVLAYGLPSAAATLSSTAGVHEAVAQLFLVAGFGLILVSAQKRLRPIIDRIFFAGRIAMERGIAELILDLSRCDAPEALARMAGERLTGLLKPRALVIYTRSHDVFTPAFEQGANVPPRFAVGSPLIAVVEEQRGPVAFEDVPGSETASLMAFQRAALDTLGMRVVVPVRRDRSLVAFLCLDSKQNGDVYTPGDLALLALVADKVSSEFLRFDQAEMIRASRALQESLRRYVPGAVAARLEGGEEVDVGQADVSVLFVDIRGYSHLVEDLNPQQIFSTVNRYTESVSSAIQEHGGTVVEFNGDGMMAVFGAPQPMETKEVAAVAAGLAILASVPMLVEAGELSVGIGVATGNAFVGSVQAVDRLIWTALGNTTNLASRLQSLTRDLGVAMIIDDVTWHRSRAEATDFRPWQEAPIRGLRHRENIHVLPLPAAA